jgi:hypothetical protein
MSANIFSLNWFAIGNTRALHDDTDYVCLGLTVNGVVSLPVAKRVGNVNNGAHQLHLELPLSNPFNSTDEIVFSYLVINHGGGDAGDVLSRCQSAMTHPALTTFNPSLAALVQVQEVSLPNCIANTLRTADSINFLWNQIKPQFSGISTDRCDGPVVVDSFSFMGSSIPQVELISQTSTFIFNYLGTDSSDLCGSNSHYSVQWSVQIEETRLEVKPFELFHHNPV